MFFLYYFMLKNKDYDKFKNKFITKYFFFFLNLDFINYFNKILI
jgi:hypothetical protein